MKPLQNAVLWTESQGSTSPSQRQIHITTLQVPVVYQDVLDISPGLHARPPILPPLEDPAYEPVDLPQNGFDFIMHVGVAGMGPLRLETLGHKLGYASADAKGEYAPIVELTEGSRGAAPGGNLIDVSSSNVLEDSAGFIKSQPIRGFGEGYEELPEELYTGIDVTQLVSYLKENGVQV